MNKTWQDALFVCKGGDNNRALVTDFLVCLVSSMPLRFRQDGLLLCNGLAPDGIEAKRAVFFPYHIMCHKEG